MRLRMERTSLALSLVLLLLSVLRDTWGQETQCHPEIRVKRNTTYKAVAEESLKIICPVKHCGQTFNFTWCRFDDTGNCKPVDTTHSIINGWEKPEEHAEFGYMFLHFGNISLSDTGQYRCTISGSSGSSMGHSIHISFSAITESPDIGYESNDSRRSLLTATEPSTQGLDWIPHFTNCAIIVAVVVMVMMIYFLSIHACKGLQRSRNSGAGHCQDTVTYDRYGISTANQAATDRNSAHVHDNNRDRCDDSIIYATVNHQSRQEDSACKSIALEKHTEYATIQVS